jgi:hypothetical protein
MDLYRGLRSLASGEPVTSADQTRAIDAFLEMLGTSNAHVGVTIEPDTDYLARIIMGVRAERKGKRIVVTIEDRG